MSEIISIVEGGRENSQQASTGCEAVRTVSSISPQTTTPQSSAFDAALAADTPRNTWTKDEIKEIYDTPLMKLAFAAVSQFANI